MKKALLFLLLIVAAPAMAQQYTYDMQSDNSYYTTSPSAGGSSTTWGSNARTGSNWTSTTTQSGASYGQDSRGNLWFKPAPVKMGGSSFNQNPYGY